MRHGHQPQPRSSGHGFGTAPVFLAAISTILGAVLFLRFGYAVANVGLLGACLIILIGHAVTIPTALAISEIATNRRVEGGGEYFIISRSFGTTIGATIGVALYLSQSISVAFYSIAFAEAFQPLAPWLEGLDRVGLRPADGLAAVRRAAAGSDDHARRRRRSRRALPRRRRARRLRCCSSFSAPPWRARRTASRC